MPTDDGNLHRRVGTDVTQLLRRAVGGMLPERWFDMHDLGDAGFDTGQDHTMLERVGGPPVGSFHLWQDEGRIHARALPELDQVAGEAPWAGCFRNVSEAVEAIAGAIDVQLQEWTLPSCRAHGGR